MKRLYLEYFRLGDNAYRDKMKYFEDHQREIWSLEFEESCDINLDYLNCLFEVGRYDRFLQFVDEMIEIVVIENIYSYRGENIYFELLFKKAACLYNIGKYVESLSLLKQLRKINPMHKLTIETFAVCFKKIPDNQVLLFKALAVACISFLLAFSVVKILLIEPFYENSIAIFNRIQIGLSITALFSFFASELIFKARVYYEIGAFPSGVFTLIWKWILKFSKHIKRNWLSKKKDF
jgi:tetratricopeptide (TPR) repeat protein